MFCRRSLQQLRAFFARIWDVLLHMLARSKLPWRPPLNSWKACSPCARAAQAKIAPADRQQLALHSLASCALWHAVGYQVALKFLSELLTTVSSNTQSCEAPSAVLPCQGRLSLFTLSLLSNCWFFSWPAQTDEDFLECELVKSFACCIEHLPCMGWADVTT